MSPADSPRRKRFYQNVTVSEAGRQTPSYRVLLDGRTIRTPAKRELAVASREVAEALGEEWRSQGSHINPVSMPMTRLVNSAIDGVADRLDDVRADVVAYGGSDLVCYLAEQPIELVERQSKRWGEIHAWAKQALGVELALAVGVMPVAQAPAMLSKLEAALQPASPLELAALHVMTTLTGSVLLALAVWHERVTAEEAWSLAHIDEDFQIEKWGEDVEARRRREQRWTEMRAASELCRLVRQSDG